jgi:hypothetical protein
MENHGPGLDPRKDSCDDRDHDSNAKKIDNYPEKPVQKASFRLLVIHRMNSHPVASSSFRFKDNPG